MNIEYTGKLYGKIGNSYVELGLTTDDIDTNPISLEKQIEKIAYGEGSFQERINKVKKLIDGSKKS